MDQFHPLFKKHTMATNKELEAKVKELTAVIADKDAQIESLKATPEGTCNHDERIAELEAEITAKNATIAQLEKGVKVVEVPQNTVPGKYKSEAHGVTVRFKTGFVKMRTPEGLVESKEIIKNKGGIWTAFLDNLIDLKFGGFEIVE